MSDRARTAIGIALGVLLVVGFGLSRVLGGVGGSGQAAPTCGDPIPWTEAAEHVGSTAAIAGPVAAASYEPDVGGGPTFLNLGNPHPDPDRFDVVIYEDQRDGFDAAPESALVDREICVEGEVRERDGVPQIVLRSEALLTER